MTERVCGRQLTCRTTIKTGYVVQALSAMQMLTNLSSVRPGTNRDRPENQDRLARSAVISSDVPVPK